MRRVAVELLIAFAVLLVAFRADAQDLEELKKRGNQAMLDLRYTDAIEAYKAAIAVAPDDAGLYYNLGRAEQAHEDFPAAADALAEFEKRATPDLRARVPKLAELVADVRSRVGTVSVRCSADLADATVEIGDRTKLTGCHTAPSVVRFSVPAKRAALDVRLVSSSYQAEPAHLVVDGGTPPADVLLTVLAKSASGRLVVRAAPTDAAIAVDGIERGSALIEIVVPAGPHRVDVSAPHHEPSSLEVVIDAGGRRDVSVALEQSAPLTSKWWFWTAAGVVVAVIATTTVLLIVQPEKDGHSGTGFEPGRTTVSLVHF